MKEQKRKYKKKKAEPPANKYWYVAVNSYTNKRVADYLTGIGKHSENCYSSIPDEGGNPHQVWEVPQEFIHELEKARLDDQNISFIVYTRPGTAQTIREWPFSRLPRDEAPKPRPKDPGVADAEKQLDQILNEKYSRGQKKKPAPKSKK